ncbi:MAG: PP2C family protein-serine/threonine phosphatase [Candidatus Caenarcaniphilales bacterium]|nr:PP2C family protein-serine/threonine phosphatase [Candidatus Caenarcaniphilales bacterium]
MAKSYTQDHEVTGIKLPVILVLGNNFFNKKNIQENDHIEDYEIVNLKYLPTFNQIESLFPDLIILNLQGQKDSFYSDYLKLCNDIRDFQGSNIPIVCVCSENTKRSFKEGLFDRTWNTTIDSQFAFEEINELIAYGKSQRELWDTLSELEDFRKAVYKQFEQASIFQGALFNQALAKTNLKASYHYFFRKEIGGDFFRTFDLSPSHVGILIGDVRGDGAAAALLMGFVLGELFSISSASDRILWSPSELLSRLSESIYSHNKMSEMCATAWYGVLDLTNGTINYARAGHPLPLYSEEKSDFVHSIEGGSGFPLGIFPGMTFRDHELQLPSRSYLLFYTDGLTNQKDKNNYQMGTTWLNECFGSLCADEKPVTDFPAIIDSTFTDSIRGVEVNDDRLILACKLPSANQSYLKVINQELGNETNKLNKIKVDSLQLTIDQMISSLGDIAEDEKIEIELALKELFFKANTQIQRTRLLAATTEEKDCQAEGFLITWWVHDNHMDISVKLDEHSIPWCFLPYPSSHEANNHEVTASLMFFFDDVQVNGDGMEMSMRKFFTRLIEPNLD